jgi:hypothetical protein
MSSKYGSIPKSACGRGLLSFDGGAVDLATHEVWAICEADNCTHATCLGKYAYDLGDGESREVFRVRNRRDLLKHLSVIGKRDADGKLLLDANGKLIPVLDANGKPQYDYNATTRVLVVPKRDPLTGARYLRTPRPSAAQVDGNDELPPLRGGDSSLVVAVGTISADQARNIERFPVDSPQALAVIHDMSAPTSKPMLVLDNEVLTLRNRSALEHLVRRFGHHHVRTMAENARKMGVGNRPVSAGLAIDIAGKALYDREAKGRMRRVALKKSEQSMQRSRETVRLIPTAELSELSPQIGQPVTGRLRVESAGNDHLEYRFFYRGLQRLTQQDIRRATQQLPLPAETLQQARDVREKLPAMLQELVDEGVFSSSTTEMPMEQELADGVRRLGGGIPGMRHDKVVVTCPHPTEKHMVLLLIGTVGGARRDPGSAIVSHSFKPITVIAKARDAALMAEIEDARPEGERITVSRKPRKVGSREARYYSVPELVTIGDLPAGQEQVVSRALGFTRRA